MKVEKMRSIYRMQSNTTLAVATYVIAITISLSLGAYAEETLRLASGEWPPYISEHLEHQGTVSRIVTEAFALGGVDVQYGYFPWSRSLEFAKNGVWDGTLVWFDTPERRESFYISDPVLDIQYVFFHLKDYPFDWNGIDDLSGIKIGGALEYHYGEAFQAAEKSGKIHVERVASEVQNFQKLLRGRIHIFPNDLEAGYATLNQHFTPEQVKLFTHHAKPVKADPHHLLLSRKQEHNKKMLNIFNAGLKQLKSSGKFDLYLKTSRNQ